MKGETPRTVEQRLAAWVAQAPATCRVSPAEWDFIGSMRHAAARGTGYGWMQQVIEWEWQHRNPRGAWGPEHFGRQIEALERELQQAQRTAYERAWLPIETGPHSGIGVLLLQPWKSGHDVVLIGHYANGWVNRDCEELRPNPTHWMPLPQPIQGYPYTTHEPPIRALYEQPESKA